MVARKHCALIPFIFVLNLAWVSWTNAQASDIDFRSQIAPIFARHCLGCHGKDESKGGVSLHTKAEFLAAEMVVPGEPDSSQLLELITPEDGEASMPKDGKPLSEDEIKTIRTWILQGAKWPEKLELSEPLADFDWWSYQPLKRPEVPKSSSNRSKRRRLKIRNPIDAFVQRKLDQQSLEASPEASRATLIRRLYFDLIGLPPTPKETAAFVKSSDPKAYENLVDQLLASPRYGERWARHWLDVVHYADTHGYDKDKPRPFAFPYRDYVIRSFNQDKPYSRFVREQIAGDALWPNTTDGVVATGFIAAGPWDFIGHAEVPESKIDGKIARHLDRDDMVKSTLNTFCSVTIQCARCHQHKFDPISQEHYYSLQAVFAALDRADRRYDADSKLAARRYELEQKLAGLYQKRNIMRARVRELGGDTLAAIDRELERLRSAGLASPKKNRFGYHSSISKVPDATRWVQIDLGKSQTIDAITLIGAHDNFNRIGHGFGFPVRYRIEASNDAEFRKGVKVIADNSKRDQPNPGTKPQRFKLANQVEARYVRITATRLASRKNDYIFSLGEVFVEDAKGHQLALGKKVTAKDSIEAPVRWQKSNLVDGYYFGVSETVKGKTTLDQLESKRESVLKKVLPEDLQSARQKVNEDIKRYLALQNKLPPQQMVYAGTIHTGTGTFVGTGRTGGAPRPIHVLARGDIQKPGKQVGPGTLPLPNMPAWQFRLPKEHEESQRRIALANWLVDKNHPLTWRSIVNRIWLYHFGNGIVETPNDFGRMGKRPTHPELLDWLAVEFRDGGQSMKKMHRLIVLSSTYRQESKSHAENEKSDQENRYLWRMNRRRLSAEEIRDAVLFVSGKLNDKMYGPGFQAFVIERPEHSPHYEYEKYDPGDPETHRRSVYRFIVRSQPDPFMTTLDCADSSQSVPKRDETITALQALSLLNNKFMLAMSEHFAERIEKEESALDQQVSRAFELVTGHAPDRANLELLESYAKQHGTQNLCRLLLNLNEFVFVD